MICFQEHFPEKTKKERRALHRKVGNDGVFIGHWLPLPILLLHVFFQIKTTFLRYIILFEECLKGGSKVYFNGCSKESAGYKEMSSRLDSDMNKLLVTSSESVIKAWISILGKYAGLTRLLLSFLSSISQTEIPSKPEFKASSIICWYFCSPLENKEKKMYVPFGYIFQYLCEENLLF